MLFIFGIYLLFVNELRTKPRAKIMGNGVCRRRSRAWLKEKRETHRESCRVGGTDICMLVQVPVNSNKALHAGTGASK